MSGGATRLHSAPLSCHLPSIKRHPSTFHRCSGDPWVPGPSPPGCPLWEALPDPEAQSLQGLLGPQDQGESDPGLGVALRVEQRCEAPPVPPHWQGPSPEFQNHVTVDADPRPTLSPGTDLPQAAAMSPLPSTSLSAQAQHRKLLGAQRVGGWMDG